MVSIVTNESVEEGGVNFFMLIWLAEAASAAVAAAAWAILDAFEAMELEFCFRSVVENSLVRLLLTGLLWRKSRFDVILIAPVCKLFTNTELTTRSIIAKDLIIETINIRQVLRFPNL